MTDYVLVHGGWCGGWCYDRTRADLEAAGHRVLVSSLAGLGDRQDELSPAITLSEHVHDVVSQIEIQGFERFNLVGHSYGGMVITGAASQLGSRIDALIYLDGFVPQDGQSVWDITAGARDMWIELQRETPGLMAPPGAWQHLPLSPQPLLTALEPIKLTGEEGRVRRHAYVYATGYPNPYAAYSDRIKCDQSWDYYEIECGHFIMAEKPERLLDILLKYG